MSKIDLKLIEKLVAAGKIKESTLNSALSALDRGEDAPLKMAKGGIVPPYLDPNAPIVQVPDVATMSAPAVETSKDWTSGLTPEQLQMMNDPLQAKGSALLPAQEGARTPAIEGDSSLVELEKTPEAIAKKQTEKPVIGDYFSQYENAIASEGLLGQEQAMANAKVMQEAQGEMIKEQQRLDMLAADQRELWSKKTDEINQALAETSNAKVDPNRFWSDKTTGQKMAMAVSLFFSGVNGSSQGMQFLDNAINRDIEAQKADLAIKRDGVQMRRGLLSDMMQRFGDEKQAVAASKVAALNMAELKMKALASTVSGKQALINAQKGLAELGIKKAEAVQKFKDAVILSGEAGDNQKIVNYISTLPTSLQGKMFEEKKAYDQAKASTKAVDAIYSDLSQKGGLGSTMTSPRMAALERRTATAKLYPYARILAGPGTFSESDFDNILKPYLPGLTDTDEMIARKQSSFKKAITDQLAGQYATLQQNGLVKPLSVSFDKQAPVKK